MFLPANWPDEIASSARDMKPTGSINSIVEVMQGPPSSRRPCYKPMSVNAGTSTVNKTPGKLSEAAVSH